MQYLNLYQTVVAWDEYNVDAPFTLFLVHGNSGSSAVWKKQVISPQLHDYRIVTIDLPGHGASLAQDGSLEIFSVTGLGRLLAGVVNALCRNQPWSIAGFSLGGNVVAEMLAHEVRPAGLVLVAAGLVGSGIDSSRFTGVPVVNEVLFSGKDAPEEFVDEYLQLSCVSEDPEDVFDLKRDFYATHCDFRAEFTRSVSEGDFSDEVALVKKAGVQVLAVSGSDDPVIHPDTLTGTGIRFWRDKVHLIEKASHTVMLDQPENFNRLVGDYLKECCSPS